MTGVLRMEGRSNERAVLAAVGLCALTGVAMAVRPGVAPLVAAAALLAALSIDWRRGVVALLVGLPFAGLPVFVAGAPGLALRDIAITAPLYAAFALAMLRRGEDMLPPLELALPALAVFTLLVIAGIARAPSLETGIIGAKVWLAYLPMLAVGYHYVRRIEDFEGALRLTALVGLIPAAIALSEWLLATCATQMEAGPWVNHFGPFDRMYGGWYENVKWSRVVFGTDSRAVLIPRVPSTFTGSSQYFAFALTAYAAGLSMALRRRTGWWSLCALVLGAAAIASGIRAAYVAVPALSLIALILAGVPLRWTAGAAVAVAVLLAGSSVVGGSAVRVIGMMPAHAQLQIVHASNEFSSALHAGLFGNGTGWDTNSALRYGASGEQRYIENWYAKAAFELGVAGLTCVVVAFAAIGARLAAAWRRLDVRSRQSAAAVLALLVVMAGTLFKGPYVDLDPLNVYAWLLVGMLLGLYRCSGAERGEESA
jgi:hypothetical protein